MFFPLPDVQLVVRGIVVRHEEGLGPLDDAAAALLAAAVAHAGLGVRAEDLVGRLAGVGVDDFGVDVAGGVVGEEGGDGGVVAVVGGGGDGVGHC